MKAVIKGIILLLVLSIFSLIHPFGFSAAEAVDIPVGFGPNGVAIDQNNNKAVVANQLSNSVSVIDLSGQQVIANITVGLIPTAVAIDTGKDMAVVTSGLGTISVIDLNTLAVVKTIQTYKLAKGISINQSTHIAYVINYDDSVSVLDLSAYTIIKTISATMGTDELAIDPGLNYAVIVKGNSRSVSVMDLTTYQVIKTVPVGNGPSAIDINPEIHVAAVVNTIDGTVSIINLQTWQTTTVAVGTLPGAIAINPLDNTALVVCGLQRSLVQIDLTTNSKIGSYPLHWLSMSVAVNNFTNMAGVTEDQTSALTLIQLNNPVPVITSVTPASASRGNQGLSIAISGNKFVASTTGVFGSMPLNTTFTDNHNLQAAIPAGTLSKEGTFNISVTNPQPGGGASTSLAFAVINPVPAITTLNPGSALADTPGLTLSVYGSGFFDDTTLLVNGASRPFALASQTAMQAALTAADLANVGNIQITASNPAPGGGQSQPAVFSVLNPVPALASITPSSVTAGSQGITLTLNGNNFVRTSTVSFNNAPVQATYVSGSQLSVPLSSSQISAAGSYTVQVSNAAPGGGTSNILNLTVNSASNVAPLPDGSYGKQYEDLVPKDATMPSYDPKHFSLITGLVKDSAANSLSGVSVTVLGHPEYGTGRTDGTGRFSIPINGGGTITVVYQKTGLITSHRQVDVGWNKIATAETITMIPEDTVATSVTFDGNPSTVITHRSSTTSDASGSRAVTMVFIGDNHAYSVDSKGNETPLASITTRSTEFSTPASMPAKLPPTTAFTYCADLTAAEAPKVRFDKPVVVYVENFLNFRVGTIVPSGYYDRDKGVWLGEPDGVVVQLLDTNGDGIVDAYDNVGDGQRHGTVAGLTDPNIYKPGATYWRVEVSHFSAWDWNWPFAPPSDATYPNPDGQPDSNNQNPCDNTNNVGSYIECRSRIVHEDMPILGTDMTLHYASNRVKGNLHGITVPASGASVPASLQNIIVTLDVAGRFFQTTLPAAPNQKAEFQWDGTDFLGRPVAGTVVGYVSIGFVYQGVRYTVSPGNITSHWGLPGDSPATQPGVITGIRTRQELTVWKNSTVTIYRPAESYAEGTIAAGWTVSSHHSIDPSDPNVIYRGDGTQLETYGTRIITTFAGNRISGFSGDGGPAKLASFDSPGAIALDSSGNVYISEHARIRKVATNGVITTIAGTGYPDSSGDGGPAVQATLQPDAMALDGAGNMYIADGSSNRIKKIDTNGIITTIAGGISSPLGASDSGDGGAASQAGVKSPTAIAIDNAGNIYVTTGSCHVRKIDTNGIITTIAGNGDDAYSGDGGPATKAGVCADGIAADIVGNIYLADWVNNRIRKVDPSGIISTIAGNGNDCYHNYYLCTQSVGDGGLATKASLFGPQDVTGVPPLIPT